MEKGYANGDTWPYLVIAHEWGHAIQDRLGDSLTEKASELQADCLAGAALFGAAADGELILETGDQKELAAGRPGPRRRHPAARYAWLRSSRLR